MHSKISNCFSSLLTDGKQHAFSSATNYRYLYLCTSLAAYSPFSGNKIFGGEFPDFPLLCSPFWGTLVPLLVQISP